MTSVNGATGWRAAEFADVSESSGRPKSTVQYGETTTLAQVAQPPVTPAEADSAEPAFDPPAAAPLFAEKSFGHDPGASVIRARLRGPQGGANTTKTQGAQAAQPSALIGMRLGLSNDSGEVRVTREVGSTQGYEDRLQAIAVARMGKAEPAAVIQDDKGKWHAVETNASFSSGGFKAADTPTLAVVALPSSAAIDEVRRKVNSLKQQAAGSPDAAAELRRASLQLASLIFGVPETDIQFNRSSFDRKSGKININPNITPDGVHGPETQQGEAFQPGIKSAFEINLKELDDPAAAASTMFHEVSHLKDYELAQKWVTKYEKETHGIFVNGPGLAPFKKWLDAQAPARLSLADSQLIMDTVVGANSTTEARAYIHSAMAAFAAGDTNQAAKQLAGYASGLKRGETGQPFGISAPVAKSAVQAELTSELRKAYRQMSPDKRKEFDTVMAAARKAHPKAWISQLDLSKP